MRNIRLVKYMGSKHNIAREIAGLMPAHRVYLEPFLGTGAVFFAKKPSLYEVLNDLNGEIVNLFQVIRERPEELAAAIEMTPWARQEHRASKALTDDPVENARRFLVRYWQAWGGKYDSTWSRDYGRRNTPQTNKWRELPAIILEATDRLKHAYIECRDALDVMADFQWPDVLIYADPPYVLSTRRYRRYYKHEMTDEQHHRLIDALEAHPGPVIVSGMASPLYDERLRHWRRVGLPSHDSRNHAVTEVLWLNEAVRHVQPEFDWAAAGSDNPRAIAVK